MAFGKKDRRIGTRSANRACGATTKAATPKSMAKQTVNPMPQNDPSSHTLHATLGSLVSRYSGLTASSVPPSARTIS